MASKIFFMFICIIFNLFTKDVAVTTLPKFSNILIFGDSLLDTGNNNFLLTLFQANHPPYGVTFPNHIPTGRFSDGKLMSDFMAEALGIKDTVPPALNPFLSQDDIKTGVCFASAGSGYDELTTALSGVIPVTVQYTLYFSIYKQKLIGYVGNDEAMKILNNTFVFVTSGSNDMSINYYSYGPRRFQYPSVDQYHDFLMRKIESFVKALYKEGLRNFAIAGLPPLGCGPLERTSGFGCSDLKNKDCERYNERFIPKLAELQASLPGSKLVYVDLYTPLTLLGRDPLKYGILNPNASCCGIGALSTGILCNPLVFPCLNPQQYLFFDSVHPTQTAYRFMSDWLIENMLPQFVKN